MSIQTPGGNDQLSDFLERSKVSGFASVIASHYDNLDDEYVQRMLEPRDGNQEIKTRIADMLQVVREIEDDIRVLEELSIGFRDMILEPVLTNIMTGTVVLPEPKSEHLLGMLADGVEACYPSEYVVDDAASNAIADILLRWRCMPHQQGSSLSHAVRHLGLDMNQGAGVRRKINIVKELLDNMDLLLMDRPDEAAKARAAFDDTVRFLLGGGARIRNSQEFAIAFAEFANARGVREESVRFIFLPTHAQASGIFVSFWNEDQSRDSDLLSYVENLPGDSSVLREKAEVLIEAYPALYAMHSAKNATRDSLQGISDSVSTFVRSPRDAGTTADFLDEHLFTKVTPTEESWDLKVDANLIEALVFYALDSYESSTWFLENALMPIPNEYRTIFTERLALVVAARIANKDEIAEMEDRALNFRNTVMLPTIRGILTGSTPLKSDNPSEEFMALLEKNLEWAFPSERFLDDAMVEKLTRILLDERLRTSLSNPFRDALRRTRCNIESLAEKLDIANDVTPNIRALSAELGEDKVMPIFVETMKVLLDGGIRIYNTNQFMETFASLAKEAGLEDEQLDVIFRPTIQQATALHKAVFTNVPDRNGNITTAVMAIPHGHSLLFEKALAVVAAEEDIKQLRREFGQPTASYHVIQQAFFDLIMATDQPALSPEEFVAVCRSKLGL